MESIWIVPCLMYGKLVKDTELGPIFVSQVPQPCFVKMMHSILTSITTHQVITEDIKTNIERYHTHVEVTKEQYLRFVEYFMESARDIGIDELDLSHIYTCLMSLESLFIFHNDSYKIKSIKRIQSVIRDLQNHDVPKSIIEKLENIQNDIANLQ